MQGIIHPYYMVALAPAIGALVGVGATSLWQARLGIAGRRVRRRRGGGDRLVVLRAARQDAGLAAVAALARADRGAGRHGRAVRGAAAGQGPGCAGDVGGAGGAGAGAGVADAGAGLAAAGVRAGGGARRAARLLPRHGEPHVHRGDTERRANGDGRVRRAWRGPGRIPRVRPRRVRAGTAGPAAGGRRPGRAPARARALGHWHGTALELATARGPAGSAGSAGSAAAPARGRPAPGPGPARSLVAAPAGSAVPAAGSAAGCPAARRSAAP